MSGILGHLFGLDLIQVHLFGLMVAAGSILLIPVTNNERTRIQSGRSEVIGAVLVAGLVLFLLVLLLTSWASKSICETQIDLLAIQWYWTASSTDVVNMSTLEVGDCWSVEVTSIISTSVDWATIGATAIDVLHSLYVPVLLIRTDIVPSRVSITTSRGSGNGLISGQCSELCGSLHGFMAWSLFLNDRNNEKGYFFIP